MGYGGFGELGGQLEMGYTIDLPSINRDENGSITHDSYPRSYISVAYLFR